jgi:small subunit ribosomal protein S21
VKELAIVEVHQNESLESALRRFKRRVQVEGIITDVKKRAFYLSPSEKRRIKSALARRRDARKRRYRNSSRA